MMTDMNVRDSIVASRKGADVLVAAEVLPLQLRSAELSASDGQTIVLAIEAGLRCVDSAADRQMLAERFLAVGANSVDLRTVSAMLLDGAGPALKRIASGANASELVVDASPIKDAVRKALDSVAFACGMEIIPPLQLTVTSPTLDREKQLQRTRQRQEEVAKLQQEALGRASELAKQVEALKSQGGSLGAILAQTAQVDRGDLLRAAFMTCADSPATLLAAAGAFVIFIDATKPAPEPASVSVGALGALRSLQRHELDGQSIVCAGARGGVCFVDPSQRRVTAQYPSGELNSEFGFNATAILRGKRQLLATHAAVGLCVWNIDAPLDEPVATLRASDQSPGCRCVTALDDRRAVLATGGSLVCFEDDKLGSTIGEGATIVAIGVLDAARFAVVREDGQIDIHDVSTLERIARLRRGSRISSAAAIDVLGTTRLLIVSDEGPVQCVSTDDEVASSMGSAMSGFRDVAASNGRVAAVSSDRQRVVIWNAWEPGKPLAEVHISGVVRHRVADVCFG
jgi:hypothetical protein